MKSIEEKIKEIAKQPAFAGYGYIFENWYDASTAVSRVPLPAIITILPVNGSVTFRNGRTYDTENIAIAFVDKVPRNANGEDNERAYNRMKAVGVEFIKALNASGYFAPLEEQQPYQVICEQMSDVVTGVFFTLKLQEVGRC